MECVAREIEKLAARYHLDLLLCESMAYCHDIFCVLEPKEMLLAVLLRQYMHNTEIAVTMRLSTILKTIKQPL